MLLTLFIVVLSVVNMAILDFLVHIFFRCILNPSFSFEYCLIHVFWISLLSMVWLIFNPVCFNVRL